MLDLIQPLLLIYLEQFMLHGLNKPVDILKGIEKADIRRFIKGFLCRSEEDIDALSSIIVKLYNLYRLFEV